MQLKSRIKSMTQYSVKGSRIFPTQLLTADGSKSIQFQGIGQKPFQKVAQGSHVLTPQHHPQGLRLNHRHSIEIGGYQRCHTARPSQDFGRLSLVLENARVSELEGNLSTRADHPLQRYSEVRESERLSKFSQEDQALPTFKAIKAHTNKVAEERPPTIQGNHFDRIKMGATLKQVQQQKTRADNEEQGMEKVYKKLYIQYRTRYERAQKDNSEIMDRFRKVDNLVEQLYREKAKLQEEVRERSIEGGRVKELQERIVRLEESIKTNRRINDALMRKEKELEQRMAMKVGEMSKIMQEMEELSMLCTRLKEENIHLDNENLRLDSENVRLSKLYEQLTKECERHPKKEDVLDISSRLNKAMTDNCLLEQSNEELHRTLLQLTQNCNASHERISWLQNNYKQLESNLLETQEELMRVGLQFVNYKLSQQYQQKSQQQQSSNCTPQFDHEDQEKLSQFQANTNHIISSDSDDEKHHELPRQTIEEDYKSKGDMSQSHSIQQVYSIA